MREDQLNAGVRQTIAFIQTNLGRPDMFTRLGRMVAEGGEPVPVEQLASKFLGAPACG